MNMLFERFISKERNEPPDIDVDFEHERREEVIQYIYANTAATAPRSPPPSSATARRARCATSARRWASISRRSTGWPKRMRLVGRPAGSGRAPARGRLRSRRSRRFSSLIALVDTLLGFPAPSVAARRAASSSRAARCRGWCRSRTRRWPDRTVIQWDKDDLDALGLLKVDVLALGMLTAIRRALDLVNRMRGKPFAMADIPPEDPGGLRDDLQGRHHRRVPDRIARADEHAAAPAAARITTTW